MDIIAFLNQGYIHPILSIYHCIIGHRKPIKKNMSMYHRAELNESK